MMRPNDKRSKYSRSDSRRSFFSEAESEVGSLLSGLSQARKIPDRRNLSRGNPRSNPLSTKSQRADHRLSHDIRKARSHVTKREARGERSLLSAKSKSHYERYISGSAKEMEAAVRIQAIARGYIRRFAIRSKNAMKQTKMKFFAITIQAIARGYIHRKTTGRSTKRNSENVTPEPLYTISPNDGDVLSDESNMSLSVLILSKEPLTVPIVDKLGDSHSDMGSIMSCLSSARQVPDRRRKDEKREKAATKIQTAARAYITRFQTRSEQVLEQTKRKFFAIVIQAYARGCLQRKTGVVVTRRKRNNELTKTSQRSNRGRYSSSRGGRLDDGDSDFDEESSKVMAKKPTRYESSSEESSFDSLEHSEEASKVMAKIPKRVDSSSDGENRKKTVAADDERPMGKRRMRPRARKFSSRHSDSDKSEDRAFPMKNKKNIQFSYSGLSHKLGDGFFGRERPSDDPESDLGSLVSGLSMSKVPDRRRKNEKREKSATIIQALARGYIQKFAFRSRLVMENTKKRFFAIQIQAQIRGFLCRKREKDRSRGKPAKTISSEKHRTEKKEKERTSSGKSDTKGKLSYKDRPTNNGSSDAKKKTADQKGKGLHEGKDKKESKSAETISKSDQVKVKADDREKLIDSEKRSKTERMRSSEKVASGKKGSESKGKGENKSKVEAKSKSESKSKISQPSDSKPKDSKEMSENGLDEKRGTGVLGRSKKKKEGKPK